MCACSAPPAPIAALLSPVLWRLNAPDRFDMYSMGVVLLQMAFPGLRTDNALIAFNRCAAARGREQGCWALGGAAGCWGRAAGRWG